MFRQKQGFEFFTLVSNTNCEIIRQCLAQAQRGILGQKVPTVPIR